jgi:hypothetical protein
MKDELLFFCLRMNNEGLKAATIGKWQAAEWDELIRQSERHGVSAYLYRRLKELVLNGSIPTHVERRFREITLQNASRNIRLYHELGKTLKILADNGIPVILLKGAHLAEGVYGNIALRPMGDVDILLKKKDLHKTVTLLLQTGFHAGDERQASYIEWSAGNQYHILPNAKHFFDLVHPAWRVKLDVHCSLVEDEKPFNIDTEGLWDRAQRICTEGVEALTLSPVDLLLYQCLHASIHHLFEFGLRPFCDIFETIRCYKDEINWEQAQSRAVRWGVDRCTFLTLYLSRELLGAMVPDEVLKALQPRDFNPEVMNWARERIMSEHGRTQPLPSSLILFWKTRRFRNLVSAFLNTVFLSRRKLAIRYNTSPDSKWIFLYYPVRLKDLVLRWGRMTWDIMVRNKKIESDARHENASFMLEQWLISKD